jgi:hypothetical protein
MDELTEEKQRPRLSNGTPVLFAIVEDSEHGKQALIAGELANILPLLAETIENLRLRFVLQQLALMRRENESRILVPR